MVNVYCGARIDEARTAALCETKFAAWKAERAKFKRVRRFRDRYLSDCSTDRIEWHRRWDILVEDPALSAALYAEDYARAAQRAAELGLTPNEDSGISQLSTTNSQLAEASA